MWFVVDAVYGAIIGTVGTVGYMFFAPTPSSGGGGV